MDVDPWNRFMDCFTNLQVGLPGVTGMNSSLETDFAGTTIPGFPGSRHDFIQLEVIGFASKVFRHLSFGKSTKPATEITDIRVVDIPIDGICHFFT